MSNEYECYPDQNRDDDDEYDDTESNDKHETRTATARHPEHSASMCIAFTTRNEDLRRRRKRGNAAKMRISAKIVLFLRILRLLVVAHVVAREEFRRCVSLVFRIFWSEAFCVTFIHTKG